MLWKDFFQEIRKTLPRYISLLFIVALGVAFFAGVRSAEPDMRLSADAYYDEQNFMDIRVISTLGLTDKDLNAIRQVEGVTEAEGIYTVNAFMDTEDESLVAVLQSVTGNVNQYRISEGRLPENTKECLLDEAFLLHGEYAIGDTIYLRSGTDEPLTDSVAGDAYEIVGFGISPMYLTWKRGTASIGSGQADGFVVLVPEAFKADYYDEIYVTTDQADPIMSMSDEYDDMVQPVIDAIEEIAEGRLDIRYHELTDEPYEELEKARKEVEDGWAELENARQELDDAYTKLEEGEEQIAEARLELSDAEVEIQVNERTLADAKAKLEAGRQEYEAGLAEYNANLDKLTEAESQLTEGKIQYNIAANTVESARSRLEEVREQLEENKEAYENAVARLEEYGDLEEVLAAVEGYAEGVTGGTINSIDQETWKAHLDQCLEEEKISQTAYDALIEMQAEDIVAFVRDYTTVHTYQTAEKTLASLETQIAEGEAELIQAKGQLDAAEIQVNDGQRQLQAANRELTKAAVEIGLAEQEINSGDIALAEAREQLESGKRELAEKTQELQDGWTTYYTELPEAEQKLADGEADLLEAEQEIKDAERELKLLEDPEWYVLGRANGVQTYAEYNADADRIGAVGEVFPAFFFLVAALVSLTTMTRMVEEQRTLIGTMKALGYSKFATAGKYMLYALSASLAGSVLGALAGEYVLPQIIIRAYGLLYLNLPVILTPVNAYYGVMATAIAVICTTAAALFASFHELMSGPAALMRPVAPKQGKRVFFERITFLWRRMSFTTKATIRNLFRYKKRFFMTVFGIGGCMALLMVGFGLKDSISAIIDNQYNKIWTYDASVSLEDSATQEERDAAMDAILSIEGIGKTLETRQMTTEVEAGGITKSVTVFVPQSTKELGEFVCLKSRTTGEVYALEDDGVIINEKLASIMEVGVGDTITIKDGTHRYSTVVTAISENYLNNFMYMTAELYEELYGETPVYNTIMINLEEGYSEEEMELSKTLLEIEHVTGSSMVHSLQEQVESMMKSLDLVVWVLIGAAGLLAYVVLYNLNNINITERRRELATLKVLGFYNEEVASYVYRENVILTIFGILFGVLLGILLHRFVILTVEMDILMFGRSIRLMSYVYSILITFFFAVVVNGIMYFSLKKIDMVESLKSVE